MRLRDKSLEELEDLEAELSTQEDDQGAPNFAMRIDIYREMYQRLDQLVHKQKVEYKSSLDYVKKRLIYYLIDYGSYLKMVDQKDDHLAIQCLWRNYLYRECTRFSYLYCTWQRRRKEAIVLTGF